MTATAPSAAALLGRAEAAWSAGDTEASAALFERAAVAAERAGELPTQVAAVLGLASGQRFNVTPGRLPVLLHSAYETVSDPGDRARLAAALARCWAYANEPGRAAPFAVEALGLAEQSRDQTVLADALDAALASHWGPDDLAARRDWAVRLGDAAAHLPDPESRLQSCLWELTVAWEVLDLPRMHRSVRTLELLGEESARAAFFAASRRLPLELLRTNLAVVPVLLARAAAAAEEAAIPDAFGVLHSMRGYAAYFAGDGSGCAAKAEVFESYADEHGIAAVRAEGAVLWLGAGRLDKVAGMVGAFTPEVLHALPRDSDWLLILQCVAEGAIAVCDKDLTAAVVTLLRPYASRSVVNAGAVMWHGVTDDTLGRGLALLGDAEAGAERREAAMKAYGRIGAQWWSHRLRRDRAAVALPQSPRRRVAHLHGQPGGLWLVGSEDATAVLPRMRGLEHLHTLIRNADTDVLALELASIGHAKVEQSGLEVLDDTARRAYLARIAALDTALAHHPDEPAPLRRERDALLAELARATGLGGRGRVSGGTDERARVSVRKAIINALARIAEHDPWLARHLHDRVRTGFQCRYKTDRDNPVDWVLS